MKKIAARLDAVTQHERRKRVIALRKAGKSGLEITMATGLSSASVSTIWQRYLAGGLKALEPRGRGRRHGDGRSLTSAQEEAIRELLLAKTPNMLGLVGHLWTRETIGQVAEVTGDAPLSTRTVSNYLQRWRMTLPQPATSARNCRLISGAGLPMVIGSLPAGCDRKGQRFTGLPTLP